MKDAEGFVVDAELNGGHKTSGNCLGETPLVEGKEAFVLDNPF